MFFKCLPFIVNSMAKLQHFQEINRIWIHTDSTSTAVICFGVAQCINIDDNSTTNNNAAEGHQYLHDSAFQVYQKSTKPIVPF